MDLDLFDGYTLSSTLLSCIASVAKAMKRWARKWTSHQHAMTPETASSAIYGNFNHRKYTRTGDCFSASNTHLILNNEKQTKKNLFPDFILLFLSLMIPLAKRERDAYWINHRPIGAPTCRLQKERTMSTNFYVSLFHRRQRQQCNEIGSPRSA